MKCSDFIIKGVYNETPGFGGVLKTGKCFSSGVKGFLHTTGVQIPASILGYLMDHRWAAVVNSLKDGVSSEEELRVLCV
jgi:hypothetical protein